MDGWEVIKAGLARAKECQREMTLLAAAAEKEQLPKMKEKETRCRLFPLRWARERLLRGSAVPVCLLIAPVRGKFSDPNHWKWRESQYIPSPCLVGLHFLCDVFARVRQPEDNK